MGERKKKHLKIIILFCIFFSTPLPLSPFCILATNPWVVFCTFSPIHGQIIKTLRLVHVISENHELLIIRLYYYYKTKIIFSPYGGFWDNETNK